MTRSSNCPRVYIKARKVKMKTIMYAQRVEGWRERWARHKYYLMDLNRTNNANLRGQ